MICRFSNRISGARRPRSAALSFRAWLALACVALAWAGLTACGGAAAPPPTPTLDPQLALGQKVFVTHCGACHSGSADTVIVGPSLAGMAERGATRVDGLDARAYVYSSVLQPSDYLVEGFEDLMPKDLAKKLTGEELDGVVAYVLSLK
jgi:nitric oxide reductase subunit C